MSQILSRGNFLELTEALSVADYEIKSIKAVCEIPAALNPEGYFSGFELKVSRKPSMISFLHRLFFKDNLAELIEALSSIGYSFKMLKVVNKPKSFKGIKLRISN